MCTTSSPSFDVALRPTKYVTNVHACIPIHVRLVLVRALSGSIGNGLCPLQQRSQLNLTVKLCADKDPLKNDGCRHKKRLKMSIKPKCGCGKHLSNSQCFMIHKVPVVLCLVTSKRCCDGGINCLRRFTDLMSVFQTCTAEVALRRPMTFHLIPF